MLQFVFDTDHLTLYELGHAGLGQRIVAHSLRAIGVSVVTVEESLAGRLAALSRARDGQTRMRRYAMLLQTFQALHQFAILGFDQTCEDQLQRLLALRLRIGTQDLKIAAIALAGNLTLLTRNRRDFVRIPGLVIDDWSI